MSDNNGLKGIDDLLREARSGKQAPQTGGAAVSSSSSGSAPTITSEEVGEKFEKKMLEIKLKELEEETNRKADAGGFPYLNLVSFPISENALIALDRHVALENKTICFFNDGAEVRVGAMAPDEKTKEIMADILKNSTFGGHGQIYQISQNSFDFAYKSYDRLPEIRDVKYGVEITAQQLNDLKDKVSNFGLLNGLLNEEKNMTNIIAIIIAGSLESGASDIHIEAEENEVILRYRIDGVLQRVATMAKSFWQKLDSRIKNIAGLKINVTAVPQDGRITIYLGENDKLELRVSTLPTAYGESIVMRLLKSSATNLKFEDLGLRGKAYEDLKKGIEKTTGMVVTTGPTGSGKTTTLYAILNKLNDGETKIITLEDPVEYKLKGISQSQIEHSKGYSFASGLRSLMRQDPDVIMVGELRDTETVEVAIEAALTGHKVVSTIHTNDAAGAIPRFLSMGAKPFLLAPALNTVIGQRLVRRSHKECKVDYTPEPDVLKKAQDIINELPDNSGYPKADLSAIKWQRGRGCEICKHIGFKGRVGVYEIFGMSEEFERLILTGSVSRYDMAATAKKSGMITMVQDGILKAMEGMTTLEEVFDNAG